MIANERIRRAAAMCWNKEAVLLGDLPAGTKFVRDNKQRHGVYTVVRTPEPPLTAVEVRLASGLRTALPPDEIVVRVD